jgi:mono/diheme cytochrome c family protein
MGQGLLQAVLLMLAAAPPSPATLAVYKAKCQQCHMANGNSPLPPLNFADGKWKHGATEAAIAKVITEGVAGTAMKPFKAQLTREQIEGLAAYVRAFAPPPKPKPSAPPP